MRRFLHIFLLAAALTALFTVQASALEFTYDAPEDYLFGRPTSQDAPYTQENPNVNRSKNVALVPPGFGTPTSYLPGSGEYLERWAGKPGGQRQLPLPQHQRQQRYDSQYQHQRPGPQRQRR